MTIDRRRLLALSLAGLSMPAIRKAHASEQALRMIVPYGSGSPSDVMARLLAPAIMQATGRSVIVDNKPGAASVIGSSEVNRAKPDGSTVLYTSGGHTTNAALLRKLPYDSVTGFTPITLLTRSEGFGLVVNASSGFQTLAQFVEAAKAKPGIYTYGTSGTGGTPHLFGALFARTAGVDLIHVPFKWQPVNELLGGFIDVIFAVPTTVLPHIESGKLRMLALGAGKRSRRLPQVPTFKELRIDAPEVPAWSGIFGPPGMPADVVDAVYKDVVKASNQPSFREKMREFDSEIVTMPPAEFRAYVMSEITRYKRVLPPLGIQID